MVVVVMVVVVMMVVGGGGGGNGDGCGHCGGDGYFSSQQLARQPHAHSAMIVLLFFRTKSLLLVRHLPDMSSEQRNFGILLPVSVTIYFIRNDGVLTLSLLVSVTL